MAAPMPTAGTCRARLCLAVRPWAARRVGATAGTMTWGVTGPETGPGGQEGPCAHLSRHRTPGVGLPGMPGASCRRGCARGPSRPQCLDLLSGDASRRHQLGVAVGIDATMVARPCPSQMMLILCITPSLPNLVVSCAHGHGFGQPPSSWCPLDASPESRSRHCGREGPLVQPRRHEAPGIPGSPTPGVLCRDR
jgi:hypothetical protein